MTRSTRFVIASFIAVAVSMLSAVDISAQYSMDAIAVAVVETFGAYDGSGFAPMPAAGQLDSDAYRITGLEDGDCLFGATCTSGDFAKGQSTGPETSGGLYSFIVAAGLPASIGFGVQPTGNDFTPGTVTIKYLNNTGEDIADFNISYELWVNNNADRSNTWNALWSMDDALYVGISSLDYTSAAASDANGWVKTDQAESVTLPAMLPNGSTLYIQFLSDDDGGSGSRDEFAVRNISITPFGVAPVELSSFNAAADGDQALLTWTTASEDDFDGFEVQRLSDGAYTSLGFVAATGSGSSYSFRAADVAPGVNTFRLKSINRDGTFEYSSAVRVEVALPTEFQIRSVYPNPFTDVANVEFAVQREQQVEVSVFDMTGRQVARLYDAVTAANDVQRVAIDSADLPAGVYIVHVRGEYFASNKQVTLVR